MCLCCASLIAQTASKEIVDYENFDADLFSETISKLVNDEREKRHRKAFRYKNKLEQLAYAELEKKSGSYFKPDFKRKQRLLKYLQKQRRVITYQGSYLECSYTYLPALQFDKKTEIYL